MPQHQDEPPPPREDAGFPDLPANDGGLDDFNLFQPPADAIGVEILTEFLTATEADSIVQVGVGNHAAL